MHSTSFSRAALTLAALCLASCAPSSAPPAPCPPGAPAASGAPAAAAPPAKPPDWLVEDFETPGGRSGGYATAFDTNQLGTEMRPTPFAPEKGGAKGSPGQAAHVFGTLGAARAPWSWAQLQVFVDRERGPKDLRAYRTLRFFVKGNGGRYAVTLQKEAVKDFDHFRYEFVAPSDWTEIAVPFTAFAQGGWGRERERVFDDVTLIQFASVEHEKPFDLWVDDVRLSPAEGALEPFVYDTAGWFPYAGTDVVKRRGSALDVSRLLDAPAGKYGRVQRRGERLAFANGKPIRFFGVNVVASANFPSHAEAERLAELFAQLGVNVTRHHHMDAPWSRPNLFGNRETTLTLDAEALDRFDYFVAALQKRGIYQFFDLIVHRKAYAADGVAALEDVAGGYKIEGEFDPKLIELQERFIDAFMGHENPYTRQSYARSPGLALLEVINEDSLLWIQRDGDFAVRSPHYRASLARAFSAWLKRLVPGGRAALEARWKGDADGGQGLASTEDPANDSVDPLLAAGGDYRPLTRARALDTFRFLYDTELGYYRRIEARLRKLGYTGLVAGSNHWVDHVADLRANAALDFVDRHSYWAHPNGGYGYSPEISWSVGAMVKDTNLGIVGQLARRRVKGLPYTASEWQASAPNDYRAEGLPLIAAYASLHGMHPIQFAFSHDREKRPESAGKLESNFDLVHQPNLLAAWPAAALLFHRADVRESELDAALNVETKEVFDPTFSPALLEKLGLVTKAGVAFGRGKTRAELDAILARHAQGSRVRSATGELVHDAGAGTFTLDTARSQGFVGFRSDRPIELKNLRLELASPFAAVLATALGDEPIASAKRVLVTALGNAVNTGQTLEPSRARLRAAGGAPILVEPIRGRVALRGLAGPLASVKVYPLGPSGERGAPLAAALEAGALAFPLAAESRALHYEVVRD